MPAVVDLEKAASVAAVTDDVAARIGIRAAGLLCCDGSKQVGVDAVPPCRGGDLWGVRNAGDGKLGSDGIRCSWQALYPRGECV